MKLRDNPLIRLPVRIPVALLRRIGEKRLEFRLRRTDAVFVVNPDRPAGVPGIHAAGNALTAQKISEPVRLVSVRNGANLSHGGGERSVISR